MIIICMSDEHLGMINSVVGDCRSNRIDHDKFRLPVVTLENFTIDEFLLEENRQTKPYLSIDRSYPPPSYCVPRSVYIITNSGILYKSVMMLLGISTRGVPRSRFRHQSGNNHPGPLLSNNFRWSNKRQGIGPLSG